MAGWVRTRDPGIPRNPHPAWRRGAVLITERDLIAPSWEYPEGTKIITIWRWNGKGKPRNPRPKDVVFPSEVFNWRIIDETKMSPGRADKMTPKKVIPKLKRMSNRRLLSGNALLFHRM